MPVPSLAPGQENAQGHSPAVRAAESFLRGERPIRGPEQMPVEDARENGAPLRPNVIVTSRGEDLRPAEVSGPSFLGLTGDSSSSADYLLEDESHGSWRKWAVLVVILVIALLFYLQWRNSWGTQPPPPAPAQSTPPQDLPPQGRAAPASEATGIPAPASSQQAANAGDPAASPSPPADAKSAAAKPPEDKKGKPEDNKAKADDSVAAATPQKDDGAEDQPSASAAETATKAERKTAARPTQTAATASSARADAQRDPMLYMAQKYIYGQGVPRNCDQAMVYLRAANQKASAPARSQMGALYATGQCVPLDRIRAYQWFTSALNLEPGNSDLQRERNNLWAQMSSAERQQAVR